MSTPLKDIAGIRKDYSLAELNEEIVGDEPVAFFNKWFDDAMKAEADEVNAMVLASVDKDHKPHARIVLLKGVEENGFIFFTNYNSAKGSDIAANNNVALVFFWKELERQVRIEGTIEKIAPAASEAYFKSRPVGSQIGAWSSPQSSVIENRDVLEENYKRFTEEYGENVPLPTHWGGYKVSPNSIEFWQGRPSRMHDRILFTLGDNGEWSKCRLAP